MARRQGLIFDLSACTLSPAEPCDSYIFRVSCSLDDEELVKTIPLRRVGEHIELANLAAFLVSDGAAYINGDAVVIDGGKMQSGGGGASTQSMLDWTDEQWEAIRPKKK